MKCRATLRRIWAGIHAVDKSLILFMLLLLVQSAYTLFAPGGQGASDVDIVVRTSSAAIFGYFLSANFSARTVPEEETSSGGEDTAVPAEAGTAGNGFRPVCLQVAAATGIGLFCLFTLILLRDSGWRDDSSTAATVVQFRDFVSSCVGFLIGSPTRQTTPAA